MQCELHKEMPYTRLPHCIGTARRRAMSEWVASGGGVRVAAGGAKKRARPGTGRCGGGEPGASREEQGDAEGEGEGGGGGGGGGEEEAAEEEGDEEMDGGGGDDDEEEEEEEARVRAARELDEPAAPEPTLGSILWRYGTRRGSWTSSWPARRS